MSLRSFFLYDSQKNIKEKQEWMDKYICVIGAIGVKRPTPSGLKLHPCTPTPTVLTII